MNLDRADWWIWVPEHCRGSKGTAAMEGKRCRFPKKRCILHLGLSNGMGKKGG